MKYKYVVWDWNGTLFNDVLVCIESMNEILLSKNLKGISNIDEYRLLFCFPVKKYYEKLPFDFSVDTFEDLAQIYIANYSKNFKKAKLFNGATDVLNKIKSLGIQQLIVSASKQDSLNAQMQPFNLEKFFIEIMGINDHYAVSKIELAKRWVSQNGISFSDIIFIGDTIHDFEVSQAIGSNCILISQGHQAKNILQSTSATIVSDICDVLQYI